MLLGFELRASAIELTSNRPERFTNLPAAVVPLKTVGILEANVPNVGIKQKFHLNVSNNRFILAAWLSENEKR